ncbi:MAG: FAD-binding oxidoreductase [Proteobacteria bacterium]|nr:FAD-binding oxidoreductase [Pseudomonadota bacterium]
MLADDFAADCYWTRDAPLPEAPDAPLPAAVDVAIVGAGYTGLAAARETALAGRRTLLLDAGPIGGGCSARNGGQVAFSLKPSLATLAARHGAATAARLYGEGFEAVDALRSLARDEQLDCDWREVGCFVGAHTPRHFGALVREAETQPEGLAMRYEVVPRARQREVVDTARYHGGVLYPGDAAVHPARLVRALHARAVAAGAECRDHTEVHGLARSAQGFELATARGRLRAREVLIATNGYTGRFAPWFRRRLLPIGSYIIATEALEPAQVARLIVAGRNVGDTRRVVVYYRPSPDGRRILFGGRAAARETDAARCVPRLRAMLADIFPELARVRVSAAWMGFVGFTFDTMPHFGVRDGIHYSLGYCGQGVPSATYYGRKIGLKIAGRPGHETALDGLPFPSRPFYTGNPWFLPWAIAGYRLRDRLGV